MRVLALSPLLFLVALGCTASSEQTFSAGGAGPSGGDTGAGGESAGIGGGFAGTTTGSGGGSADACSDAAKLIYVLSTDNDLYSFDPLLKHFAKIGPLACPTSMLPNSMAVDRGATAWVNYVESDGFGDTAGAIFKVDTSDGSCEPTSIHLGEGWYRLGMGFSTDVAGAADETLFVTGTGDLFAGASPGLGRVDLDANTVVPVGQFSGSLNGQNAELTGTGDARLYGFFTTTPVEVAEIHKGSGGIVSQTSLPQVETPNAWAFSFWGGDFYLYTAPDESLNPSRTTNVTRYRPSDGSTDTSFMTNIGFRIVGAGVSTCAPVKPPA